MPGTSGPFAGDHIAFYVQNAPEPDPEDRSRGSNRCKKIGPLKGARSLGGINLPHAMLLEAFGAGLTNNPFERGQNLPGYSIFFDPQLTNA